MSLRAALEQLRWAALSCSSLFCQEITISAITLRVSALFLALATCASLGGVATAQQTSIGQSPVAQSANVDLRVDANRDGKVDLNGSSDSDDAAATARQGAVFLPNLDDDARRCEATDEVCSDATDDVVNGPSDAADLAPVRSLPMAGLSADARGKVTLTAGVDTWVRVFVRQGDAYTVLTPQTTFTAEQLNAGLTLGVEGKDIVRDPAVWDGVVQLTLSVTDGGETRSDSASLRVAPMLSHHHNQVNQQVVSSPGTTPPFVTFRDQLARAVTAAGVPQPLFTFDPTPLDNWTQDWVEPMYAAMPTENGMRSVRLLMRSDQARQKQQELYRLRGVDVGVIKPFENPKGTTRASYGNLETIPPHGKYPAGRIIVGDGEKDGMSPRVLAILQAQGMQDPLHLDTAWLGVGHVDEFVQFIPAPTALGFKVAIADPQEGIAVLKAAQAQGHGSVKAGSRSYLADFTINSVLSDTQLMAAQAYASERITANLDILRREIGLTDADIVRVPSLFRDKSGGLLFATPPASSTFDEALAARRPKPLEFATNRFTAAYSPEQLQELAAEYRARGIAASPTRNFGAFYPTAVNGIVAAKDHVIVPQQFGPQVNGRDIMTEGVRAAYASAGITIHEVDNFETYHLRDGEVHCGSNSLRDTSQRWW